MEVSVDLYNEEFGSLENEFIPVEEKAELTVFEANSTEDDFDSGKMAMEVKNSVDMTNHESRSSEDVG